ncbi:glucose-1-phosphate thymidylyltransferase [Halarchaeum rubridurum]|uniref:Bifunctional protein GlmU n=1 Tax=Halarchaeum rubridurum TaxID=489911 RepID=A0A830FZ46_9EURY|nr:sugar phosphate nucleotidyltransferase [Halarchaeum rubridurum]MBP1953333.1 glucose-1-phosphate thymidylyltransferase [Halarchaeum rubridurum]GGM66115.1 glucose-1-phosphate thymidylyltransferase [Halarchaeum rubridurum]
MKAVILAAGEGTRLRPLTETRPKPMLRVANRPLLEHVVTAVRDAGIDEVVLVVGYRRERIQSYFGDGDDWGVDIEYATQEKQLGTGHAVLQAESFVEGPFVALNGDRIVESDDIARVADALRETGETTLAVARASRPSDYGVVSLEGDSVVDIVEKPPRHAAPSDVVNAGIYGFGPSIFDALRETTAEGELAVTDTLERLAGESAVDAVMLDGRWIDVSYLWDLLRVNASLVEAATAESAHVDAEASVVGDVAVGDDVRVRPGARILTGTALGDSVTVGANAVVANSVVLPDATIGAGAVVRDAVVGENATVGPNVTVEGGETNVAVNGRVHENVRLGGVVGDNAHVGGATTLAPGTVLGNRVDVETGSHVDGRIESDALLRRA